MTVTDGAVVNVDGDGAVMVAVWWVQAGWQGLSTVDGMRLEWVRLVRPDVASIVATVVGNLAHNPGNGPVTVID